MKRYLGTLVLIGALAGLTGCGDDPDDRADVRADDPVSTSDTEQPADLEVVDIVSGVAAGGEVAETATIIESEAVLGRYLDQFRSPTLVDELMAVVETADPVEGRVIGLAVIEVSCNEPPSAHVTQVGGRFFVTAGKVVNPHPECYAPVTSVAVLDLPAR
ncbi:hypothetical protein SFC88_14175 [Nocardioides sp. HM23]|uniref:hypothetical protein n=1 Tax=Nocardioides bizhenqiangii TaxID=3095076 RepID=UPI002ACAD74B|nr:hypothetical protein [Nocardioides sp. HM23]MDZ5621990.1 hypothetical protein [Nocardioides sp. HM23]